KQLDCSHNLIELLSSKVVFRQLRLLDLSCNQLTALPVTFSEQFSLSQILDVRTKGNRILRKVHPLFRTIITSDHFLDVAKIKVLGEVYRKLAVIVSLEQIAKRLCTNENLYVEVMEQQKCKLTKLLQWEYQT